MSVTLDTNVLVYASNAADRWHQPALAVVERLAAGPEIAYVFWSVLLGYLRIVTHAAILPRPLSAVEAMANIEALIDRPHIRVAGEGPGFWEAFKASADVHIRGNEVPDAHLVALMLQHGVHRIHTRDRGFRRFDGIAVLELTEMPVHG